MSFAITGSLSPLLNFILLPVFSSYLSPASFGVIAFIDSIVIFMTLASIIGLHNYFMKNYFHCNTSTLYSTMTRFLIVWNLIVLAGGCAGSL